MNLMGSPLVSVIVPVYNRKATIFRCLDSILKQSYRNLEVLVIDDGSDDGTSDICRSVSKTDACIKLFSQDNHGVSFSRNRGIAAATGKYVVFIDSDDYVNTQYVEGLVCSAERERVNLTISKTVHDYIDINHENHEIDFHECVGNIKKDYVKLQKLNDGPVEKLYKLEIIKKNRIWFPETMNFQEDCVFNMLYYNHIQDYRICLQSVYHVYRIKNDFNLSASLSRETFNSRIEHIRYLSEFLKMNTPDDSELAFGAAIMGAIRKAIFVKDSCNNYQAFLERIQTIASVSNLSYSANRCKTKMVLFCFKYKCYWPIYLYYKIRLRF